MSHLSVYLSCEVKPAIKVLKGKTLLKELPPESQDVFHMKKFQVYFLRPDKLRHITYPDLYKWWR